MEQKTETIDGNINYVFELLFDDGKPTYCVRGPLVFSCNSHEGDYRSFVPTMIGYVLSAVRQNTSRLNSLREFRFREFWELSPIKLNEVVNSMLADEGIGQRVIGEMSFFSSQLLVPADSYEMAKGKLEGFVDDLTTTFKEKYGAEPKVSFQPVYLK